MIHRPRHLRREPGHPQDIREDRIQFNDKLSRDFGAHRPFGRRRMSRIAKTGVFNADSVGVYTFAAGTAYPFDPRNPATFPAQFVQGFTDPRRPISLHRDFAPFDFAGIDRSYRTSTCSPRTTGEVRRGFTLNLGARYEKQTSSPDNNNIMPRTGFAWDLNRDGRTVVRGGYGRFYDQLFDNIPNTEDLFGITGNFSITLTPGGNPGVFPVFPAVLTSLPAGFGAAIGRTVTLDLGALDPSARKTPFSDQVTIGVARELRDRSRADARLHLPARPRPVPHRRSERPVGVRHHDRAPRERSPRPTRRARTARRRACPDPTGSRKAGFKQIRAVVSEGNGWYHGLKAEPDEAVLEATISISCPTRSSRAENEQDDFGSAAQGSDPFDFRRALASNDVPQHLWERHLRPAVGHLALGHRGGELRA